jgi:hypothetical protein
LRKGKLKEEVVAATLTFLPIKRSIGSGSINALTPATDPSAIAVLILRDIG